jgi:hypothetical protein
MPISSNGKFGGEIDLKINLEETASLEGYTKLIEDQLTWNIGRPLRLVLK